MTKITKQPGVWKTSRYALFHEDCLTGIPRRFKDVSIRPTLLVADFPHNTDQPYANYNDRRLPSEYLRLLKPRIEVAVKCLHVYGSVWFAVNDTNVSEVDIPCQELGLFPRKKVCWFLTFGQNNANGFTPSHITWLYYSKHRTVFTFNADDPKVRIPSARQSVYKDKRANSKGRLPDDFWILRPQEIPEAFHPLADCWYFPKVCGTFKAKVKGMPNQMPALMMERIVRFCSNPGEIVLDPYSGTGQTGVGALRCGRKYVGFDVSRQCLVESDKILRLVKEPVEDTEQLPLFD